MARRRSSASSSRPQISVQPAGPARQLAANKLRGHHRYSKHERAAAGARRAPSPILSHAFRLADRHPLRSGPITLLRRLALLVIDGLTPAEAVQRLPGLRPHANPNPLFVGLLDDAMDSEARCATLIRITDAASCEPPTADAMDRTDPIEGTTRKTSEKEIEHVEVLAQAIRRFYAIRNAAKKGGEATPAVASEPTEKARASRPSWR